MKEVKVLESGMKLVHRDNYVLASMETNNLQATVTASSTAANLLECFGNLVCTIQKLLVQEKIISHLVEREVCNFGFVACNAPWMFAKDNQEGMRYYLINYMHISRILREKHNYSTIFNRKMSQELLHEMKIQQMYEFCLRGAIGVITDRFVQDPLSKAWLSWHNAVRDVVEKYSYELRRYEVLLQYHTTRDKRQKVFEKLCKLPMFWEVERQHVIERAAKNQEKSDRWVEKSLKKWEAADRIEVEGEDEPSGPLQ